jgi:adenine-specific DNA-methyltransferase
MVSPRPTRIEVVAYETDPNLCRLLVCSLSHLGAWLGQRGIEVAHRVVEGDFVLEMAAALGSEPRLFSPLAEDTRFEIAIANPPYFKIPRSDSRAQAARAVVHGQPNIYALFMAVAASLLAPGGELVGITPRSYCSGPYFRAFRERFFEMMVPEWLHVFESRRQAFRRDDVLQENVVLKARRADGWWSGSDANDRVVIVSCSDGARDLGKLRPRSVGIRAILDRYSHDVVVRIPVTKDDEILAETVEEWKGCLHAYGLQISTGPVVPFRAVPLLAKAGVVGATHAPLLWMQNVHAMRIEWPAGVRGKPQYIRASPEAMPLLVPDRNYVLVRRFSSKEQTRRLTAAPLLAGQLGSRLVGIEHHLNYVHRPNGTLTADEAWGLAVLYNSSLLDRYFRTLNGNTQVSATELRAMPLPSLDLIREIGKIARRAADAASEVETLAAVALGGAHEAIQRATAHG